MKDLVIHKPDDLVYGVNDRPPPVKSILLAIQTLMVILLYLVVVVVVARKAGLSASLAQNMISFALIGMGVGTILQAFKSGPIGSGYLIASCVALTYLAPALIAVSLGGIALMSGMMIFAGVVEMIFASVSKKLRFMFPPVVTGLIFCFLAMTIAISGMEKLLPNNVKFYSHAFHMEVICFVVTLFTIIALSVWAKGIFKLLCLMLGLILGCILAYFLGLFSPAGLNDLNQAPFVGMPNFEVLKFNFDFTLIPLFFITAIAAGLRTIGVVTSAQRINDAAWSKPDTKTIQKGVLGDGLSVVICGIFNTIGVGTSPSSVGISKATGATSRVIAFFIAGICFILAFTPKIAAIFMSLPIPIVAAGLIFASCLMFVGGLQIITARELTMRHTLTIGLAFFIAISPKVCPEFYSYLPESMRSITSSIMVFGALSAVLLNIVFRISIKQKYLISVNQVTIQDYINEINKILKRWNISSADINHALEIKQSIVQSILESHCNRSDICITVEQDELSFSFCIEYEGVLPKLGQHKHLSENELIEDNVFITGLLALYHDVQPERVWCKTDSGRVQIKGEFTLG